MEPHLTRSEQLLRVADVLLAAPEHHLGLTLSGRGGRLATPNQPALSRVSGKPNHLFVTDPTPIIHLEFATDPPQLSIFLVKSNTRPDTTEMSGEKYMSYG